MYVTHSYSHIQIFLASPIASLSCFQVVHASKLSQQLTHILISLTTFPPLLFIHTAFAFIPPYLRYYRRGQHSGTVHATIPVPRTLLPQIELISPRSFVSLSAFAYLPYPIKSSQSQLNTPSTPFDTHQYRKILSPSSSLSLSLSLDTIVTLRPFTHHSTQKHPTYPLIFPSNLKPQTPISMPPDPYHKCTTSLQNPFLSHLQNKKSMPLRARSHFPHLRSSYPPTVRNPLCPEAYLSANISSHLKNLSLHIPPWGARTTLSC